MTVNLDFKDYIFSRQLRFICVPNLHEFGNNEILENYVYSNLQKGKFTAKSTKRFITIETSERDKNFFFRFTKKFINKIDNEWKVDGVDLVNNCTEKTRKKVSEILSNKNSDEKDYIILGRWVHNNIKYHENYIGLE